MIKAILVQGCLQCALHGDHLCGLKKKTNVEYLVRERDQETIEASCRMRIVVNEKWLGAFNY